MPITEPLTSQELMTLILSVRYTDSVKEHAYCMQLLELTQASQDPYATAFAHTYLGDHYITQGNSTQCSHHLRIAQEICHEHNFQDLMPKIYNFFGICHESLSDEQTAVRYYLKALDLHQCQLEPLPRCVIINNIASNFERHHDYANAMQYYQKAAALIAQLKSPPCYVLLRLWSNMAQVSISMGNKEKSLSFIKRLEAINTESTDIEDTATKDLLLCRAWAQYYAFIGNKAGATQNAHRLLTLVQENCPDPYLTFEMFFYVCDATITLKDEESTLLLLEQMNKMYSEHESDRLLLAQKLRVRAFEAFGTAEEQAIAYRDFYRVSCTADDMSHHLRAGGIKAILDLHDTEKARETAQKELQVLETQNHLDELTGLYNRRYFNKILTKNPKKRRLGIIMLDVDYFKEYNDTYGHNLGDTALAQVSDCLQALAPKSIIPCRYGGDEFICLCLDVDDEIIEAYIKQVTDRLAQKAIPHITSSCAKVLTLSIGYRNTIGDPRQIVLSADKALYLSKFAGRNTFRKAENPI